MERTYKILEEFGLTKNESIIYVEAVKHERISPFKLARLTKIPRTTVYDVMMSLSLKGLITVKTSNALEKRETWIVPKNPSVLREIIERRKSALTKLDVDIIDILPELKGEFIQHSKSTHVQFYSGIEGVKKLFKLIEEIPHDISIYLWDHLMPMDTLGREYINKEVSQALKTKKRRVKTIIPLNAWTKHVLSYQYKRNPQYIEYHEFRYVDESSFNLYQDTYIFGDRVAVVCAKDDEAWGLVIHSSLYAKSMRAIFESMWIRAQPATKEFIESLGEN